MLSFQNWIKNLPKCNNLDHLLRLSNDFIHLDLTCAHPSGLAQLFAKRKTKLSTLIRELKLYNSYLKLIKNIKLKTLKTENKHGIDVSYLVSGIFYIFDTNSICKIKAPMFLTPILIKTTFNDKDAELRITNNAYFNPALIRYLRQKFNAENINDYVLNHMAYDTLRFNKKVIKQYLENRIKSLNKIKITHSLFISMFADIDEHLSDSWVNPAHPIINALFKKMTCNSQNKFLNHTFNSDKSNKYIKNVSFNNKNTEYENIKNNLFVIDANEEQERIITKIISGKSLLIDSPPSTGGTQTLINSLSTLICKGKNILIISENKMLLKYLKNRLYNLKLDSILFNFSNKINLQSLKSHLIRSIMRNEKVSPPNLKNIYKNLKEASSLLTKHKVYLHRIDSDWQCSPYQALQNLVELTSKFPISNPKVRLKENILLKTKKDKQYILNNLIKIAHLGGFSPEVKNSPWLKTSIQTKQEAINVYYLIQSLIDSIDNIDQKIQEAENCIKLNIGKNYIDIENTLKLLNSIRNNLDLFKPSIFNSDLDKFISITTTNNWRKKYSIDIGSIQRSRLKRMITKEFIRPGIQISNLNESLKQLKRNKIFWEKLSFKKKHTPMLPLNLNELNISFQELTNKLSKIKQIFKNTTFGNNVLNLEFKTLRSGLSDLIQNKNIIVSLPILNNLLHNIDDYGLKNLINDFQNRKVQKNNVIHEFNLIWWKSILEIMINKINVNYKFNFLNSKDLHRIEQRYIVNYRNYVKLGVKRLLWKISNIWNQEILDKKQQARNLKNILNKSDFTIQDLVIQTPNLFSRLCPIWASSPWSIKHSLTEAMSFDVLFILNSQNMSISAALPSIGRAKQIILFGMEKYRSKNFSLNNKENNKKKINKFEDNNIFQALNNIIPKYYLRNVHNMGISKDLISQFNKDFFIYKLNRIPSSDELLGKNSRLIIHYVTNGKGIPNFDNESIESVEEEVKQVVKLVLEHVRKRPNFSLAVITTSFNHALKLINIVKLNLLNNSYGLQFLKENNIVNIRNEPFCIVDIDRAAGIVRDYIIFSLGYGQTPHGRALHNFGPLSKPNGREKFVIAMTRARIKLHILTCFKAEHLDSSKLIYGAFDFYNLLEHYFGNKKLKIIKKQKFLENEHIQNIYMHESNIDPILKDLANRIQQLGFTVWYGFKKLPDIIVASNPLNFNILKRNLNFLDKNHAISTPVVIQLDGSKYANNSVKNSSYVYPNLLTRFQWKYMSLKSIDVFNNPKLCIRKITNYLYLFR